MVLARQWRDNALFPWRLAQREEKGPFLQLTVLPAFGPKLGEMDSLLPLLELYYERVKKATQNQECASTLGRNMVLSNLCACL